MRMSPRGLSLASPRARLPSRDGLAGFPPVEMQERQEGLYSFVLVLVSLLPPFSVTHINLHAIE